MTAAHWPPGNPGAPWPRPLASRFPPLSVSHPRSVAFQPEGIGVVRAPERGCPPSSPPGSPGAGRGLFVPFMPRGACPSPWSMCLTLWFLSPQSPQPSAQALSEHPFSPPTLLSQSLVPSYSVLSPSLQRDRRGILTPGRPPCLPAFPGGGRSRRPGALLCTFSARQCLQTGHPRPSSLRVLQKPNSRVI